jgi:hypothetical protein
MKRAEEREKPEGKREEGRPGRGGGRGRVVREREGRGPGSVAGRTQRERKRRHFAGALLRGAHGVV